MTDTEFSASENMSGRLTAAQFSASPGVTDWRVLWRGYAAAVQHVQVAIDALDIARVRPFWHAVLGYAIAGEKVLRDAHRQGPTFWFQQMQSPRTGRNRFHIDVYLPHDQVQARIDAALAAGGRIVSDAHAPGWWTLADPEGNEADLAVWG
jgi:4a-hydroxytetrahydrobiopterin dehydratase